MPSPRKRSIGRVSAHTRLMKKTRRALLQSSDKSISTVVNEVDTSSSSGTSYNTVIPSTSTALYHDRPNIKNNTSIPLAFRYTIQDAIQVMKKVNIGGLVTICQHCQAKKWKDETAGFCCHHGKVVVDSLPSPPELLQSLLDGEDQRSSFFLTHIRRYNQAFAMTSLGCTELTYGYNWMPTVSICGRIYHRIGSLLPASSNSAAYLQLYFIENEEEQSDFRIHYQHLNQSDLMLNLQHMLLNVNSYVKDFKMTYTRIIAEGENMEKYKIVLSESRIVGIHSGRLNLPTVNDVAVLLVGEITGHRDIVIESRAGELKHVCETHPSYDPLQYPLLFPYGSNGYNIKMKQKESNKNLSCLQYYKFRLMIRDNNYLLKCRELLSLFAVDMYAKMEAERTLYLRSHQKELRSEQYGTLRDSINTDGIVQDIGRLVVLPSSYIGSPRYYHEKLQDGMSYVRKYGTADFFITMTTNPKWKEIQDALLPHQQAHHRHDVVARVFNLKVKGLLRLITKDEIFGPVKAYMLSIEWQKRGLPHVHMLLWLVQRMTSDRVDDVISAELPDPAKFPELHNVVKQHMIHGPCGERNRNSPCMSEGKCTKRYPRTMIDETCTSENGYPLYRRRSPEHGGFIAKINDRIGHVDNRWVVPYNAILLHALNAHVNVEACHSVTSVKYICKYMIKGSDAATVKLTHEGVIDEISHYLNGRYVSSNEAMWRLFAFSIHEHFPPIQTLSVHLEHGERVYFNKTPTEARLQTPPSTTLTGFFKLCQRDAFARTLLYDEVPQYFTWDKKEFTKRVRGTPVEGYPTYVRASMLGRVYTIHPNQTECYYLRLLLFVVRGPTSFEELRSYNGHLYNTYQETCVARGMLVDDTQWHNCMMDAVNTQSPAQLRQLFAMLLLYCEVSNPLHLYNEFKCPMADDIRYTFQQSEEDIVEFNDMIFQLSLQNIDECIRSFEQGKTSESFNLPLSHNVDIDIEVPEIRRELLYRTNDLHDTVVVNVNSLNEEQRLVYEFVLDVIHNGINKIMFLDAPGGTGKTYLMNLILATLRSENRFVMAVASSGIAATLLVGGRTVHSGFKVPLNPDNCSTCNIPLQSGLAKLLKNCELLIWDECSMSHKYVLECIERTLRDIRKCDRPFGGLSILFAGDFRQTLPVVKRGTRADIVGASLKKSSFWSVVEYLPPLRNNMRLSHMNAIFANTLLNIGDGMYPHKDEFVSYTSFAHSVSSTEELIDIIWPDVANIENKDREWITQRTILIPLNSNVDDINCCILKRIKSEEKTYVSIDNVLSQEEAINFPVEFLNSLHVPGLPAHILHLKIGAPVILLRNLKPPHLCNGTRLKVVKLLDNLIECIILTGCGHGKSVCIPRIPLISAEYPFSFKRIQFPLKLCFAMTINKAQGQSFDYVGLDLSESCFSHGQLYVACSRTTNPDNLYIHAADEHTKNVVYREVFD